ncbi:glutathione reductase [Lysinibacillus sp. B2A1]|nr:glutathione reductase [Lysinibacillus sp. B2A1]
MDWREAEEDLIDYFNEQLPVSDQINCEIIEIDKPRGVDIVLSSQENSMTIPFADDVTDRDSAIRAMQEMLSPQYQIRWFMESLGNDTLAFALLPVVQWKELEQQFDKRKVDYYFQPVTNTSVMFEMGIDEVDLLMKSRATELLNI